MSHTQSNDLFVLHRIIRFISGKAVSSFFTEVRVIGGENVPAKGPVIVAATHHNMMLDPAVLSLGFPHRRILNYWSKATLFANPIAKYILLSSGNIPVDRKSKDRRILFKGTFEALSHGQAVALFPEGTSYTEPRIMQVKDGAAWAALEYTKWAAEQGVPGDVTIIPAAIVYTNKSKYRSSVIMEFGRPITMDPYKEQFFSDVDGAPRSAVKRLTRTLQSELEATTINAPDWDTLYAARMARDVLWSDERTIQLEEFVAISQTLVDLFSTPDVTPNVVSVKRHLLEYYSLLQSTNLTNSVLSALPLPRLLDPNTPTPLPSRLYTLLIFIRDTLSSLTRLPFFLFPLIVYLPMYVMGRYGARLVEDEEETQAQNKVVFGLLGMIMIYPAAFFFLWALFWYTPIGAVLAALTCYLFAVYHNRMINDTYEHAKRFIAAWRILIGVWAPKKWDMSISTLSQYTTPRIPKENPWVDKPKSKNLSPNSTEPSTPTASSSSVNIPPVLPPSPEVVLSKEKEPPATVRPKRRPSTRRIMRHVLRARLEATKALGSFFEQLEHAGHRQKRRVVASPHLAQLYGGFDDAPKIDGIEGDEGKACGWRHATEVIGFLRKRGAKIPSVKQTHTTEEEWAVLSSDGESITPMEEGDIVWIAPKAD